MQNSLEDIDYKKKYETLRNEMLQQLFYNIENMQLERIKKLLEEHPERDYKWDLNYQNYGEISKGLKILFPFILSIFPE